MVYQDQLIIYLLHVLTLDKYGIGFLTSMVLLLIVRLLRIYGIYIGDCISLKDRLLVELVRGSVLNLITLVRKEHI